MTNIDLNNPPASIDASLLDVSLKTKETSGERGVRLFKDVVVFSLAVLVSFCAFLWSGWILLDTAAGAEEKQTAQTVFIALVSALVGYLIKK